MKKLLFLLWLPVAVNLSAQECIAPTIEQIERFSRTTLNVVLPGENIILEAALKEAIENKWKITPLKFIDKPEFEANTGDANRTFLLLVGGSFHKNSEEKLFVYTFLNLLMGGGVSLETLSEFLLLPVSCDGQSIDKSLLFMDAFVDIMQRHIVSMQQNPKLAKQKLDDIYNKNIERLTGRYLMLVKDDIAYTVTEEEKQQQFNNRLSIVEDSDVENAVINEAKNQVIGLTLYPRVGSPKGTFCYNMLIAADTHELIYYKRHNVSKKDNQGFLKEELKRFGIYLRKSK
ncbi:MAG: hypothetical protein LBF81_05185 [Prevotellaceae bacterium]|jgi:hypothetical protein|nr:hypothetical protein [Prevotellaceae bacterium]